MLPHTADQALFPPSETGLLAREIEWSRTPLGAPDTWPHSLRAVVGMALRSKQPMLVAWGPDLVTIYNDAYIRILGLKHPHALGQPMSLIWAEVWESARPINEAVMRGESLWFENMRFELSGRERAGPSYFSFSYTPLHDDNGAVAGLFCSAVETTDTVEANQRKSEEVERQRRLFEQAPGFICTLQGPDHIFDFVNASYRRLFGRSDIVGKPVREAFPELAGQGYFELLDEVYRSGERYVAHGVPARVKLEHEEVARDFLLDFVYAPILDDSGRVAGIFCEGHDVTAPHESRLKLAEREEQLRLATENAEIGLWDVDTVSDTLFWPPRVKAMFGISADRPVSMADFYEGLHPEDRDRTSASFAAACDPATRSLYDVEYRTIGKEDGKIRWVAAKGRAVFDASGRCIRVIGTAIDITARKQLEAAQRDADRRKDEFIATLSHELRNPLAPLRNAVHLLRMRPREEEERQLVEMMDRQLRHLVRLVDDLLEVSRITRGMIDLRNETVDVRSIVDAAAEAAQPVIAERHHSLTIEQHREPVWVRADAVRIAQVVGNLLSNAARYSDAGGTIHIASGEASGRAFVRVRDSGRGFTPEEGERIFDMFVRAPDSPGLGIGLALAMQLARLHGGTLDGRSDGPGKGATFTLWLPIGSAPELHGRAEVGGEKAAPRRILIVDDNQDAAESLRPLLELQGHSVSLAASGPAALQAFPSVRPDVVLLDVGMPEMDGYEVARRLRSAFPGGSFRIVGLSGWGQESDRRRGKEAGFDDHLIKPVELDALNRALAHRV